MKPKIYVTMIICMAMLGCKKEHDPNPYYPNANQVDAIVHNGVTRTYILHVPASYTATAKMPLVIGLHGHASSGAAGFESWTHWSEKADVEGFIVAYPNGLHYYWDAPNFLVWNAGGPYEEWTQENDDVGFIDQVIDLICEYYSIDASRIYVTGHSNGSRMTYRIGYELSKKIAAIAPHSGQMIYVPAARLEAPVPVLHLHALDDSTAYYKGSTTSELHYSSADTVLSHWASYCSYNTLPDTVYTNSDYLIKQWKCAANSPDIKLCVTNRGGHNWFTMDNSGISATDIIWDFFKAHPKK